MVTVLLMIGIISYLIAPLVTANLKIEGINYVWLPSNITSGLLLIMVWFIFEEDCRCPPWIFGLVSLSMLSSVWFCTKGIGLNTAPLWLQGVKLVLLVVAVGVVWNGRDNDLVELRYKVRNVFVAVLAILMLFVIAINMLTGFKMDGPLVLLELVLVFGFSIACNYVFIKFNPQFLLMAEPTRIKEDSEDPVIVELLEKMRSERLYADHGLRVASLAELMKIPEYKLRAKINQQLGYRNFNQFVNRYRIEEAGVKLLENSRTPVLTIALDVGFSSISSFNTAFQTQFGVSPTKYRVEAL